jgi:hypothetical protein
MLLLVPGRGTVVQSLLYTQFYIYNKGKNMSTRKAQIIRQEQELTAQTLVQERERQRQAINKKLDQLFVN